MKGLSLAFLFLICTQHHPFVYCQMNMVLKNQLDSVFKQDQLYRNQLNKLMTDQGFQDSILMINQMSLPLFAKELMDKQELIDLKNQTWVDSIVQIYGYPGTSLVGSPSNEIVWHIYQHSFELNRHLKIIKRAVKNEELAFEFYAKMYDRDRKNKNKKQLYGTQFDCKPNNLEAFDCYLYQVKCPKKLNQRRLKAGFSNTVEEEAKKLGIQLNE